MKINDIIININLLILLFFLSQQINAQQYKIKDVPNPKTTNNTWVSDPDNILYPDTERLLNDKINTIEKNNGVEITIVALNSIGKVNVADFAVDLFNYWKVGKAGKNNGLLILLVMDQRRVEFKTGYGLEEILTDKECVDIQQQFMVPEFKSGDYNRGIIAGLDAVAVELLGKDKWQRTAMPDELLMLKMIASKTGKKLSENQKIFDADTVLTDSIYKISEQIAKVFQDSFDLGIYVYIYKSLNGISPIKMTAYLDKEKQYTQKNKNLMIWVFDAKSKSFDLYSKFDDQNNVFNNRALLDYYREQIRNSNDKGVRYMFQNAMTEMLQTVLSDSLRQQKIKTQLDDEAARSSKENNETYVEPDWQKKSGWGLWWTIFKIYLTILMIFTIFTLINIMLTQFEKNPYRKYKLLAFVSFDIWIYLFPIPFLLLGKWIDQLKKQFRDAPRKDQKSGKELFKLSDREEDEYLKAGQLTEEMINSIHYDVWASADKNDILVLSYPIYFTPYSHCSKCRTKAYYLVFNRTITAATTYSSGVGEKKYECKHCKYTNQYTYIIPKIEKSSSSSSSGGGGGGSFGGGSSGGGGGGSNW
jgi:uncharacterized membrane protein YgcG